MQGIVDENGLNYESYTNSNSYISFFKFVCVNTLTKDDVKHLERMRIMHEIW